MESAISNNVKRILACPQCGSPLRLTEKGATCETCHLLYGYTASGALDLRLQNTKMYHYEIALGKPSLRDVDFRFDILSACSHPEVDYSNVKVPNHLTRRLLSHFPKAKTSSSLALDIGCGNMIHKQVVEIAGFEYVGLDYYNEKAHILGDAHALPFGDESFEFVLSIAALQYFRYPFIAIMEAFRVLKPGGIFIGTAAFLEPFHDTFFHFTHWGIYSLLKDSGFEVISVCPENKWTVLTAQAEMGLFPQMPQTFQHLLVWPVQILHRIWWKIGSIFSDKATEATRVRNTTGSFSFVCRK